ncbi:MAG: hypothetical protein MUF38_10630 [Anaerolineae bacterium]|nr:hypothetical protein [Anaerolineae bacterium]
MSGKSSVDVWEMMTNTNLGLLLIFILNLGINIQTSSLTPAVYFYSRDEVGFVIQRADGSEQELWIEYTLDENYLGENAVVGPGWSASGGLFAWMVQKSGGGSSLSERLWIMDADGNEIASLMMDSPSVGIAEALWSPMQDILWVMLYDNADVQKFSFMLYDPLQRKSIFTTPYSDYLYAVTPQMWW